MKRFLVCLILCCLIVSSQSIRIRRSGSKQEPRGVFESAPTNAVDVVNRLFTEVDKAQTQTVAEWTKDLDLPEMKDNLKDRIDEMVNARMAKRLAERQAPTNSSKGSSSSSSSSSQHERPVDKVWPKLTPSGLDIDASLMNNNQTIIKNSNSSNDNNNSSSSSSAAASAPVLSVKEQIQIAIKAAISAAKAKAASAPPSGQRLEKPVMLPQGVTDSTISNDINNGANLNDDTKTSSSSNNDKNSNSNDENKSKEENKSSATSIGDSAGAQIPLRIAYEPQATFANNKDDDLQSCQIQDINDPTETTVERAQSRIDQLKKKLKCMRTRGEDVQDEIGTLRRKIEREQNSNTEQINQEKQALAKDSQTFKEKESQTTK